MYIVNTSFGYPAEYSEETFDTKKEAVAYCREHNIPLKAIKRRVINE